MKNLEKMISVFLTFLLLKLVTAETVTNEDLPTVTEVTPKTGSLGGGMKLTIKGSNFALDQSEVANEVVLTNGVFEIGCDVLREDTTTQQIVCYTEKGMEADVTYWVRVKVNGEKIPEERLCNNEPNGDDCSFRPSWSNTPVARTVEPQSGMPGDDLLVKISGDIVTTRFGSGEDISKNGEEKKLVRVYGPGITCELKDGDSFYGLYVADDSYEGYMICKPNGTFVGCANMTFMVEAPFGRSVAAGDQLFASSTGQLCMIQYYTDVSSVSPAVGSTEGNLTLRITGSYYERGGTEKSTYTPTRVYIGGTVCEITEVEKDEYIECTVAKQPDEMPSKFSGGRGVDVEFWVDGKFADLDALEAAASTTNVKHFDLTKFSGEDISAKQTRMIGRFIPPKSGNYAFRVKATYKARLSIDGVAQATSTGDWESGGRLQLVKDQPYRLMVAAMGPAANPDASSDTPSTVEAMAVFFDEEKFTKDWTENAFQEEQILRFSSTPTQDVQVQSFSQGTIQSPTAQVQRICIEGATFDISIGMFKAFTGIVGVDDATKVEEALNNAPYIDKNLENFIVKQLDEFCIEVTINSSRGDFPLFEVVGDDITATVEITTHGVPDNDLVSLVIGGRPSIPFRISELSVEKLQSAVDSMFEATCPNVFSSGSSVFESYEGTPSSYRYGDVVNEIECFCGRQSIRNPRKIYPFRLDDEDISLKFMLNFYVCFAYSGLTNVTFVFKYRDTDGNVHKREMDVIPLQEASEGNIWSYSCVNPYDTMDGGDLVEAKLEGIFEENFYVDAVYFGPKATFSSPGRIAEQRLRPASPSKQAEQVLIDHADVIYNAETEEYVCTLYPLECGYDFKLFELLNKEGDSTIGEPGTTTLRGGSARLAVERTQTASPPVQGTIKVSWEGQNSTVFDTTNTEEEIRNVLQGIPNIGLLKVEQSEDSTCHNKDLHVTFVSRAGDQEKMKLSYKEMRAPPSADVEIVDHQDGYLRYYPILGDLLRTERDVPQVEVYINDVPSYCSGDCSFQWSPDATPTVDSMDKNSGAADDVLVITGTKFSPAPEDNSVMIGDVPCVVTESTTTSITCTVGEGSGIRQPVLVTVAGKGRATGSQTFTYLWEMTSFEPISGSFGGGLTLTVDGYGFPSTATVYVGGLPCPIIEQTSAQITCTVPASDEPPSSGSREVEVEVIVPTTTPVRKRRATSMTFTYDPQSTGIITAFTGPQILSVVGGDELSVTGISIDSTVTVWFIDENNEKLSVVHSVTGEQITFRSPPNLKPGLIKVCLDVNSGGCAIENGKVPNLPCILEVEDIFPIKGSLYGGTDITIAGGFFGTDQGNVEVNVGDQICVVSRVANDQIVCRIQKAGRIEKVTNLGKIGYDRYYAWDKDNIQIEVGETVRWTWSVAEYMTYNKYGVYETESESSTTLKEGGITSGDGTPTGVFDYTFTKPGEYYFWTNYVDPHQLRDFRCKVTVKEKASTWKQIVVKVMDWEAEYKDPGGSNPTSSDSCSEPSSKTDCTDKEPTAPLVSNGFKYYFLFSSCHTPVVEKLDHKEAVPGNPQTVTTSTQISAIGNGFTSESCAIEVWLEDGEQECSCRIISSTKSRVKFSPEEACTQPTVAVQKSVSVLVKGRGYALAPSEKVVLVPSIREISPNRGSKYGNTFVEIKGTGLKDVTSVMFNKVEAYCLEDPSDTLIKCYSPSSTNAKTGEVTAVAKGIFPGACDDAVNKCYFYYDKDYTPKVSNVVPTSISMFNENGHTITFTGTNFGTIITDVTVFIGGEECTVTSVSETSIECSVNGLPAGDNNIHMTVKGYGNADARQSIRGEPAISPLLESSGSQFGGHRLVITGHGFYREGTTVTIGDLPCEVTDASISQLTCITPAASEVGEKTLVVSVPAESEEILETPYTYNSDLDGVTVNPTEGAGGQTVTISGSNFGTDSNLVSVEFGGSDCTVKQDEFSSDKILCTLGPHAKGLVQGQVLVNNVGFSNMFDFDYTVSLDSVDPSTGDTKGNQRVTLSGGGFIEDNMWVTFGDVQCDLDLTHATTSSEIVCITRPGTAGLCDVKIFSGDEVAVTKTDGYTYADDDSPIIDSVNPDRGGTGGGTKITIAGTGFGDDSTAVTVTLEGSECTIDSFSDTEIVCETPEQSATVETEVIVTFGQRTAVEGDSGVAKFWYIDAWSSTFTWNGKLPEEGDLVVVQRGHVLLLDTDTPILTQLLILGGVVIFDCSTNVELHAKYIFITNGGKLQIGTEKEPCLNKAIITLYGHQRQKELPVYGSKVLALRNGSLELHGKPIPTPWTLLSKTAEAGDREIEVPLGHTENWDEEDEIVIATTGDRTSQNQNEKHTIKKITQDGDNAVIELKEALKYKHTGIDETYGEGDDNVTVPFRAEVGLLTRTILIRGNRNPEFNEKIEKCEDGFNPGEHAIQTCFQGRFGQELGSDQFGAHIMIHQQRKDTQEAVAHIEYVEVTYAGQAFHLGRYPIHFHLNGDMTLSYVRGCAVHESFNRAINVHNTHNLRVENNVVYNIMGGAIFIEDGIETNNIFGYNLAIFVKASTSLLNDDITPAAFWLTNANNIVVHNHAAGGTHFGFWYRMNRHPDGPSFTDKICPRRVPMGRFYNNTAHSLGWFGVWTFQEWQPMENGQCEASVDKTQPAVFEKLTVWNADKAMETVDAGSMQVKDSVFTNNRKSGFEGIKWMNTPKGSDKSPKVENTWLVGHADNPNLQQDSHGVSQTGVVVGIGGGFQLIDTKFKNFEHNSSQAIHYAVRGLCPDKCGGYNMKTKGLHFDSSVTYKVRFRWMFEGVIEDSDGTLTGEADTKVTPWNAALPDSCQKRLNGFSSNPIEAAVCPGSVRFHRLAFNKAYPSSLEGKDAQFTNSNGNTVSVPYKIKRFTHKEGWMAVLVDGEVYTIEFDNAEHLTNISFTGMLSDMKDDDHVQFKIRAFDKPDRFSLKGGDDPIEMKESLNAATAENGDWVYDGTYVRFILKGPAGSGGQYDDDNTFSLTFYKCFFVDCKPPVPPDDQPIDAERPDHAKFWDDTIWKRDATNPMHMISAATESLGEANVAPANGNNVTISEEDWIVLRHNSLKDSTSPIRLETLLLLGKLEVSNFDDGSDEDFTFFFNFTIIVSPGRLIIGWPDKEFTGNVEINLVGSINSPYYNNPDYQSANIGAKAIGAFGGLDIFGKDLGPAWTTLRVTANSGGGTLEVDDAVPSWPVDGEIFVTATGFNPKETEKLHIASIDESGHTITLKETLQYTHVGLLETVNGKEYKLSAAVGLITRKIKIQADEEESKKVYGGRILVSIMQNKTDSSVHTGYARLKNVQFTHMGQDGFIEEADPRFALTALSTGKVKPLIKPFLVSKCSFSTLYNSAIGLFGTEGIELSDNVVYESLGDSIKVASSSDTKVTHNLVSNMLATASYNGRNEEFNIRFEVGMNLLDSKGTIFEENYVAASEKGGYLFSGDDCDSTYTYLDGKSSAAVSNSFGAVIFPEHVINRESCNKFYGLKLWRNFNYGFYYQSKNSVEISDMLIIDNQVGVFAMPFGPSSQGHQCEHKTVKINNCVVSGHTPSVPSCPEANPPSGTWLDLMGHCEGIAGPGGEKIGLTFGQFPEGPNKAPQKPCAGVKKSDAICGSTKITGVTLANFGPHPSSSCRSSFAIATNPRNDDGQHPVTTSGIDKDRVAPDSEVLFHRPNIGKITPADCVDMDCDGLLKNLVQDLDGSLLGDGEYGAVISESEFEWEGDPRRGRGDYRIPIKMRTNLDGSKKAITEVRDFAGIPRIKDKCQKVDVSNSRSAIIKCRNTKYKMLSIESLDKDTMSRRISPVAYSQTVAGKKYVDLINGPQDHGCCAGYSCQKRLSLFKAIVAVGSVDDSTRRRREASSETVNEQVEIYLTSTPPSRMRFLFVDPDESSCIVIVFFFWRPYRVDIRKNDGQDYVEPKNAEIVQDRLEYKYDEEPILPTCNDDKGTNYIDRDAQLIYFVLKGDDRIELKYREQVILSFHFPTLTPDEVFGIGIIENMAALLNVDEKKVRIVKVISATGGRRKRSTGTDVEVEIGDGPTEGDDASSQADVTALAGDVMNSCQDNSISSVLITDGVTCDSILVNDMTYTPVVPDRLEIYQELEPQHEGTLFLTQPKLRAYDSSGYIIQYLGIIENPWQMTATIRSSTGYSGAILGGTVIVQADNGWFNFTDLSISHAGTGYIIDFDITMPTAAADLNLGVASAAFDVEAVPLTAGLYAMTSDAIVEDTEFSITLKLRDKITDQPLEDIGWRGHIFDVACGLPVFNEISTISGNLNKTFDETSGRAQFDTVALTGYGPTYLECQVVSTPAEYDFPFYQKVHVLGANQVGLPRDTSEIIVLRFKEDFAVVLVTEVDVAQLDQMVLQYIGMKHPNVVIIDSAITEGSILITFTVEGSLVDVKAMTSDLCTDIKNGKSFTLGSTTLTLDTYMTVDGGVSCGIEDTEDDGLHPGYIALIVVLAVVVLVLIVAVLVWKLKVRPKTQTHDNGKTVYLGRGISQEGTFTSMKSRENTLYHSHVNVDLRTTPTPNVDKFLYGSEATNLAVPPRDTWPHSQTRVSPAPSPGPSRSSSPTIQDNRPMWRF